MKTFIRTMLIAAVALTTAVSCKNLHTLNSKKSAQGAPYELLIVCNAPEWESAAGEELRAIFEQPVPMINQTEPVFTVLRVTANDFKNLLPSHRNIVKVLVSPEVDTAAALVQYDVEAAPQIVVTLQAPTQQALLGYLQENGDSILHVFEMAERDRTVDYARRHSNKILDELVHKMFDVTMKVPKGYELRATSDDFLWASFEFPTSSQGFFIYTYPYTGRELLTAQSLVDMRNIFAARIPGPSKGSYMTTVDRIPDLDTDTYTPFEPDCRTVHVNGRPWIELRGLWNVENDFMGGPFVSYTTVNEATREVFTIDCYVYSPKNGKRNHLRALEHLVHLVDLPKAADNAGKGAE